MLMSMYLISLFDLADHDVLDLLVGGLLDLDELALMLIFLAMLILL